MRSGGPAGDDSVEPGCSGERRKRSEQRERSISKQPGPECLSGQPAAALAAERTCQARRLGCAKTHLPPAGGSLLAHRPAGDATAGAKHPGLYLGSLRTLQRRRGEWRITHAEQVVGQQMGAIRDQENSQLNSRRRLRTRRQLDG